MNPHLIAGLALTVLVGVSLGLLGAGGSIIMLPVLVYAMGVEPHAAVPMSLVIVGTTSLLSVAVASRQRAIHLRIALIFGGAALGGVYLGSRLTSRVHGSVLMVSFGLLLVLVGLRMWRASAADQGPPRARQRPPLMLAAGLCVGLLTGFLGVGGGFLIVPAMVKVGGLPMCDATRTSLVVIAMSSIAGAAAHLTHGNSVPVGLTLSLTLAALTGMVAGIQAGRHVSGNRLRQGFAALATSVGVVLILVNTPAAISALAGTWLYGALLPRLPH